jgi:hypothetical protein
VQLDLARLPCFLHPEGAASAVVASQDSRAHSGHWLSCRVVYKSRMPGYSLPASYQLNVARASRIGGGWCLYCSGVPT